MTCYGSVYHGLLCSSLKSFFLLLYVVVGWGYVQRKRWGPSRVPQV